MIAAHSSGGSHRLRKGTDAFNVALSPAAGTNCVSPFNNDVISRPSITRPSGTAMPASVASVGYQSIARTAALERLPACTPTPGPQAMAGTRIPPS